MRRATAVTLKAENVQYIRNKSINLSNLLDVLLDKHIREMELKDGPAIPLDDWNKNFIANKEKSERAWAEHEKKRVVIIGD